MTNGRYNIGLLVNGMDDTFSDAVCKGANNVAKKLDCNLYIFPGSNFQRRILTVTDRLQSSQNHTIFSYATEDNLDAVIISYSTIFRDLDCDAANELRRRFRDIPVVTLCFEEDGCGCIKYNPFTGISEMADHLVRMHGCRSFGFVTGPRSNPDSTERTEALRSALLGFGIELDDSRIVYGDFTLNSYNQIRSLFERCGGELDALCCANDHLALDAYSVAADMGLRVGEDILITGYDNVLPSTTLVPPLSTVNANPCNLGAGAIRLAVEMIETGKPRTVVIDSHQLIRDSCGTHSDMSNPIPHAAEIVKAVAMPQDKYESVGILNNFNSPIKDFVGLLIEQVFDDKSEKIDTKTLKKLFSDAVDGKITDAMSASCACDFLRTLQSSTVSICSSEKKRTQLSLLYADLYSGLCSNLIFLVDRQLGGVHASTAFSSALYSISDSDMRASIAVLLQNLCRLDVRSSYLYLSPHPRYITDPTVAEPFDTLILRAYHHGQDCVVPDGNISVSAHDLLSNEYVDRSERCSFIFSPLFSFNEQLGLAAFDFDGDFINYVTPLSRQLSVSLESICLLNRLNTHIEDVEMRNSFLDAIASRDSLTGLFNRYGFFKNSAALAHKEENCGKTAYVAFADMNDLKLTNDTFGHEEGDYALCLINEALTAAFGRSSVIGRIGGDEFAVFVIPENGDDDTVMYKRFKDCLVELNDESGRPFVVTASIGFASLICSKDTEISDILDLADRNLYKDKENKPASIRRSNG